jgi:hypothetical protein
MNSFFFAPGKNGCQTREGDGQAESVSEEMKMRQERMMMKGIKGLKANESNEEANLERPCEELTGMSRELAGGDSAKSRYFECRGRKETL